MKAPDDQSKARMRWPFYVATSVLVPVLYVLSVGPATWLLANGYISEGTVKAVYGPLFLIADAIPGFGEWCKQVIRWYASFWLPERPFQD